MTRSASRSSTVASTVRFLPASSLTPTTGSCIRSRLDTRLRLCPSLATVARNRSPTSPPQRAARPCLPRTSLAHPRSPSLTTLASRRPTHPPHPTSHRVLLARREDGRRDPRRRLGRAQLPRRQRARAGEAGGREHGLRRLQHPHPRAPRPLQQREGRRGREGEPHHARGARAAVAGAPADVEGVDVSRKFARKAGGVGCRRWVLLGTVGYCWLAVMDGGWWVVGVIVVPEVTRHTHTHTHTHTTHRTAPPHLLHLLHLPHPLTPRISPDDFPPVPEGAPRRNRRTSRCPRASRSPRSAACPMRWRSATPPPTHTTTRRTTSSVRSARVLQGCSLVLYEGDLELLSLHQNRPAPVRVSVSLPTISVTTPNSLPPILAVSFHPRSLPLLHTHTHTHNSGLEDRHVHAPREHGAGRRRVLRARHLPGHLRRPLPTGGHRGGRRRAIHVVVHPWKGQAGTPGKGGDRKSVYVCVCVCALHVLCVVDRCCRTSTPLTLLLSLSSSLSPPLSLSPPFSLLLSLLLSL